MRLSEIEIELRKRLDYPPTPWKRQQNNEWDRATRFVYSTYTWDDLIKKIEGKPVDFKNYSVNRWFNFWHAKQVETMFCSFPGVTRVGDPYDKYRDFCFKNLCFDHKTSDFPRGYPNTLDFTRRNRGHLIEWLYANQSQQGRYHLKNRLFVILYDQGGQHWRLRAELRLIYAAIKDYMTTFDPGNFYRFKTDNRDTLSDLVWVIR